MSRRASLRLTCAILSTNSLTAGFELGRAAALSVGGMSRRGLKKLLMPSCTDLCWKLSGRPPPAVPPPALPPSEGSSDPPQCAGDSSGQHLNIWRQGERMRVDSAQEVSPQRPSFVCCTCPEPLPIPTHCHPVRREPP